MPKFVPDKFTPRHEDIEWAKKEFRIDGKEVLRQFELMKDHEFRRSYTDFNRVFRNWMRTADRIDSLRRERQYRQVQELTEDERKIEAGKAEENLERLQQMALKVVK
jgi:hypothetical protein